ncbi:MAG: CsbD family protein [Roseiarcus sp.]
MDKDRIVGSLKEIKGAAKIAVGKAVGDAKLQSDGKVDSAIGKAQNAVGGASDVIRDATKIK